MRTLIILAAATFAFSAPTNASEWIITTSFLESDGSLNHQALVDDRFRNVDKCVTAAIELEEWMENTKARPEGITRISVDCALVTR